MIRGEEANLPDNLLYLSRREVESLGLVMTDVIAALEVMFSEKAAGRVEMPPKPGIHPAPDAFLHAMPAYIPALRAAGMKWVSGFPDNPKRGLPYIGGLIILNDVETGFPLAVMDSTWITAMRTGAATAVAAKRLARRDSKTAGILGCGAQGRSNLEALLTVLPVEKVTAYDTDPEALRTFVREAVEKWGLEAAGAASPREAVEGRDLVVTAGPILKIPHATIQAGWLKEGAFASLVDYDSYWTRAALREADKFCTDDVAQLEYVKSLGYFKDIPPVYADLGELVSGRKPGRETSTERTIACNLGLALDDMATAPLIYQRALERGAGTRLPL